MDTEDLARADRENQAPWEAEYSYLEGDNTDVLYKKCEKNPDHKKFIPAHAFSMQDLPEGYRNSDVEGYIRAVSDLTVLVSVLYVSDRRPDTFPGTSRYPSLSLVNLDTLLFDEGTCAGKFTCVEEEDLNSDYTRCQKNPGHPNFLPLDALSMASLPPLYRKDEVMKFIRIMSDLTVRVTVKYVSQDRPATVPGTDIMYPWYDHRGSTAMRVGSGVITEVDIFKDNRFYPTCNCKDCLNSPTPKTEYANIYIDTTDHLVFDNLEAEQTSCDLFFDSGKTPETSPGAVTLPGMSHTNRDMSRGWCRLTHVTHDLELAERIDAMMNVHNKCLETMEEYDYFSSMENGKQNGRKYARGEMPLHVVISHPHGCAKQVSFGYCGHPGTGQGRYQYTSTTCPGSSGASAIQLGWETLFPYVE